MTIADFPPYATYDELLQHARRVLEEEWEDLILGIEMDPMNYNNFVRGEFRDAMYPDDLDFQRAVDIVKTNPKILLTECDHGDKHLEEFVYCAIAETIIQELHKEFEPRAWAVFEEAQARLSDSPGI